MPAALKHPSRLAPGRVALAALLALCALFATALVASSARADGCPNEALRVGASASLPDCRAYEVVTPDTGSANINFAAGKFEGPAFDTWTASPNGESLIFNIEATIGELNGNGVTDQFEALRGADGWNIGVTSPSGARARSTTVGGTSPDHGYTFWYVQQGSGGSLSEVNAPLKSNLEYLREPDGAFSLVGQGSLGTEPSAESIWISSGAKHVIFATRRGTESKVTQLEPDAPSAPIETLYDRSAKGPTHTVSLLPGNITPMADAKYQGVSSDGSGIFFEVNGTSYERRNDDTPDASTAVVASPQAGTKLVCKSTSPTLDFQWLRNGTPIAEVGVNPEQHTLTPEDAGTAIQCRSTDAGATTSVSSPPTLVAPLGATAPPQPLAKIAAPTPAEPEAATVEACDPGSWNGSPTFAYQWYDNGAAIAGANEATYEVKAADVPGTLQCEVTATNAGGSVVATSANTATKVAPSEAAPELIVDVGGNRNVNEHGPSTTSIFAGSSDNGAISYYARGEGPGSDGLFEYNAETGATTMVADEGAIHVVNVSADGSHAFFLSTAALTGGEENSQGQKAIGVTKGSGKLTAGSTTVTEVTTSEGAFQAGMEISGPGVVAGTEIAAVGIGKVTLSQAATESGSKALLANAPNLYGWDGASVKFITTVGFSDLESGFVGSGLAAWTEGLSSPLSAFQGPTAEVSRTTPDGSALAFESRANLTPYDSQGHWEIYRYEEASGELSCVSCNPEGTPATADAHLVNIGTSFNTTPTSAITHIPNLTPDGKAAFFETSEALLPSDEDAFEDVYEWREGQLSLISSGQSKANDHIYGVSASGNDVFFMTNDTLAPQDTDGGNPSIYDARVDGGFPPPVKGALCEEEGCQGQTSPLPSFVSPPTKGFEGTGNVKEAKKHKHKKKRHKKKGRHKPAKHQSGKHSKKGGKR